MDKIEAMEKEARKMKAVEADVLNMLSKTMEAAEAPMAIERREEAPKIVAEVHKRLEMLLVELKMMKYESGDANQITQGVVDIVAATT